jgi:hypothetical protein
MLRSAEWTASTRLPQRRHWHACSLVSPVTRRSASRLPAPRLRLPRLRRHSESCSPSGLLVRCRSTRHPSVRVPAPRAPSPSPEAPAPLRVLLSVRLARPLSLRVDPLSLPPTSSRPTPHAAPTRLLGQLTRKARLYTDTAADCSSDRPQHAALRLNLCASRRHTPVHAPPLPECRDQSPFPLRFSPLPHDGSPAHDSIP